MLFDPRHHLDTRRSPGAGKVSQPQDF